MARSFRNTGIRRDLNFSDVENPRLALSNLLNDLVTSEGDTFTADDLDCIQNISATNVRPLDFQRLEGLSVETTTVNDEGDPVRVTATPFVTAKNQLDSIIVVTRDPPYFNGGNGLDANFYESTQINASLTKTSTGNDIFIGDPASTKEDFWDNGFYEFSNKLDETLGGGNGGIQWSGYYIPDASGTTTFGVSTSGYFMLELEDQQGNLQVVKNIFSDNLDVTVIGAVNNSDTIFISEEDYKVVAVGAAITEGSVTGLLEGIEVAGVVRDLDNGTFYITTNVPVSLQDGESITINLEEKFGSEEFSINYEYDNLEKYIPKQIRLSFWYPGNTQYFFKVLDVNISTNLRGSGSLPFWYLYTNLNTETVQGFKDFYDNRILAGGGTIGEDSVNSSVEYSSYETVSPLLVKYSPPRILSDILVKQYTYSRIEGSRSISTTSTSPLTSSLEVGNVVVGEGIPYSSNIVDIATNSSIIIDLECTSTAENQIDFINHRGYVGWFNATSSGNTVTITNMSTDGWTNNLREGMVVITSSNTNYIRITEISPDSGTTFTTDTALNLTGEERIYVYQDKGLENRTLENYCIGVLGKETVSTVSTGAANPVIPLNNVDGIITGMVVQSTPYTVFSPPNVTTVQSVDAINNTVTLSQDITAEMIGGTTIIFAPSGTTQNKEACVIPLNTAPPFVGTDTGLATTGNVTLNNGNLNVLSLKANNVNSYELQGTPTFDRTINLNIQGVTYKILGSTTQT